MFTFTLSYSGHDYLSHVSPTPIRVASGDLFMFALPRALVVGGLYRLCAQLLAFGPLFIYHQRIPRSALSTTPPSGTRAEIPFSPPCQLPRAARAPPPISWAHQATPNTSFHLLSNHLLVAKAFCLPPTSSVNGHPQNDRA